MPDMSRWLGWNPTGDLEQWLESADRADTVGFMIGHRGVSLVLNRGGTNLAAQDVLLVPAGQATTTQEPASQTGVAAREQVFVIGQPDFDVKRGDQFAYQSSNNRFNYEVVFVDKTMVGKVEARAEVMS